MNITIAGTAGRKEDAPRLNKEIYEKMIEATKVAIKFIFEKENIESANLISGGAAYADHIAVILGLRHKSTFPLHLYLPALFFEGGFNETANKTDPGRIANWYHDQFSLKVNRNSLKELWTAINLPTTKVSVHNGFHARNLEMAKSDYVIALTFGEFDVKDGGTKHMTDNFLKSHSRENLIHIPIGDL